MTFKRNTLNNTQKKLIIRDFINYCKVKDIAINYGITNQTVRNVIKAQLTWPQINQIVEEKKAMRSHRRNVIYRNMYDNDDLFRQKLINNAKKRYNEIKQGTNK